MSIEELYGAKGNDGRNLWDSVIQARNDIAELKAAVGALVWGYKNQRVNGDKDVYKMLTDMPHDVMAYKNQGVNGDRDVYRLVTDLGSKLDDLTAKVEKLEKN